MAIRLIFVINREPFRIEVSGKIISYTDRKFNKTIRLIPKDEDFWKKIVMSRNRIPPYFMELFNLTKEEQEEYDNAKDDLELSEICIRDCRRRGAVLQKREVV